jgi:hypothetical protein
MSVERLWRMETFPNTAFDEQIDALLTRWRIPMPPTLPPPPKSKMPQKPTAPPPPSAQARPMKTFTAKTWDGQGEGQKVGIYGGSGDGKTTLASMAPAPLFMGLDDGGRMIRNPITGEAIKHIPGIETFDDVRDALHQRSLYEGFKSLVIDTGTALELLVMDWVVKNIGHEKGAKVERIEDYGYGKGYQHMYDTMRLAFQDLDGLVRQGKNVIILCQKAPQVIANAAGTNYLQDGPKLYAPGPESKQSFTTRGFFCEWADHIVKIDRLKQVVAGGWTETDARSGKVREHAGKAQGENVRAIFTMPLNPSYFAKTRTLIEPVIAFAEPADNSFWQYLFPEEYK